MPTKKENAEKATETTAKVQVADAVPADANAKAVVETKPTPAAKAQVAPVEVPEPNNPEEPTKEELMRQLAEANATIATIEAVNKQTLTKVRFIKAHTYSVGNELRKKLKGDIEMVEPHLANKFVSRNIAYILM